MEKELGATGCQFMRAKDQGGGANSVSVGGRPQYPEAPPPLERMTREFLTKTIMKRTEGSWGVGGWESRKWGGCMLPPRSAAGQIRGAGVGSEPPPAAPVPPTYARPQGSPLRGERAPPPPPGDRPGLRPPTTLAPPSCRQGQPPGRGAGTPLGPGCRWRAAGSPRARGLRRERRACSPPHAPPTPHRQR